MTVWKDPGVSLITHPVARRHFIERFRSWNPVWLRSAAATERRDSDLRDR
jgi:hypothetical protein